jgi:hypothetical protein
MTQTTEFWAKVDEVPYPARYFVSGERVIVISAYGEGSDVREEEAPERVAERVLTALVHRADELKVAMARRSPESRA